VAAPEPKEIRDLLEGYNIDVQLSDAWIKDKRDSFVIPWVEAKTKLSFTEVKTVTEYYSGTGNSILVLRHRPIVELIAINYTNVPSNQFYISPLAIQQIPDEGILKARANFNEANYVPIFARGVKNLRVTYSYGMTDYPADIKHAIKCFVAEKMLGHIANRTGGGTISIQAFSRNYGSRGKFSDIRNELARDGHAIMRKYMTGVTA